MEIPEMVKINEIVEETPSVKTFFLNKKIDAKPGQFLMVWLPEVDEKPISLSGVGDKTAITVQKKGKFTEQMFRLKKGDKIGIRGPYGNGFTIKNKAIVVAGGLGIAPLMPLIEKLSKPTIILGAKTAKELLFEKRLCKCDLNICTDDGSKCFKGFTTDLLKELIKKEKPKIIYACGPEIMMKKVFDIAEQNNIGCEASLERYMRCGFGICGSCVINGFRVCKDGPVFLSEQLRQMTDFGKSALLKSGRKVSLGEYVKWRT